MFRIGYVEEDISGHLADDDLGRRLLAIQGVGPITASVLTAERGDGKQYARSRDFAASIGLAPRQYSTGGRANLLGIIKREDKNRRRLLVQCARVLMQRFDKNSGSLINWTRQMLARRHSNVVACALANKFARIAWAIAARNTTFDAGASHAGITNAICQPPSYANWFCDR
jgi:transposase